MRCGIIGIPNVGKSTLFNVLRQAQGKLLSGLAQTGNYPFTTIEPNIGVVAVPDDRLEKLAQLVKEEEKMDRPPPIIPAVVQFVDIAGLVKGAHQGEGLGNQFLSHIREVDAIIHVLRDFTDENVVRAGAENPESDRVVVETELALADLQTVDKLLTADQKEEKGLDPLEKQKLQLLLEIKQELEGGKVVGQLTIDDERLTNWFAHLPLLSIKPVLYVYNVDEKKVRSDNDTLVYHTNSLRICAKLEEELTDLNEEDRKEYLESVGFKETGLERLIKKTYQLLNLISFFTTTGKKEVRAWNLKKGTKAPQAAGVIHTDFEKNFIRAQVIEYEKLIEAGSYASAKSKGWLRTEGKDYEIKDGNVVEFLISN